MQAPPASPELSDFVLLCPSPPRKAYDLWQCSSSDCPSTIDPLRHTTVYCPLCQRYFHTSCWFKFYVDSGDHLCPNCGKKSKQDERKWKSLKRKREPVYSPSKFQKLVEETLIPTFPSDISE